jgi:hypothetical protein
MSKADRWFWIVMLGLSSWVVTLLFLGIMGLIKFADETALGATHDYICAFLSTAPCLASTIIAAKYLGKEN